MLHISQVLYKKEQSDAIKEGRPIKDFGEFVGHLNQHIYNDSIFVDKVHDNIVKILLKTQLVVEQKYAIIGGGQAKDNQPFAPNIPASSKSATESAEFKWTEEGITKLLATNPANKITPPIPPLDIMVREQSLPTTSRTVATSDISVEESNIKNLSDDELRTAFGSVTSGTKYIFFGPDEYGAKIIEEHKKRFPEAEGQKNIEVLGVRLLFNPLINLAVKEATGTKLLGETDPTDLVPTRVALPTVSGGNKILKDTASKDKIIEGKAINLETPETSGLPKEPHLPTHSDINAKAKIVEKTSMLANKVEQKLPTSEVGEVKLGTSNVASDLSLQKRIEIVTGITKPVDLKLKEYTTYLKQYENWQQLPDLVKKVPGEFGVANYNKKMDGLRWKKGGDSIRIDKGNPAADYPAQQIDHVAISYNGKVVDNTGNNYIFKDEVTGGVYKMDRAMFDAGKRNAEHGFDLNIKIQVPAKHPDAHIPADQWAKWKSFHKPD